MTTKFIVKYSRINVRSIVNLLPGIGRFNGRTILTDAGWTRNWRLVAELWQDLIGEAAVQNNDRLRGLMLCDQA